MAFVVCQNLALIKKLKKNTLKNTVNNTLKNLQIITTFKIQLQHHLKEIKKLYPL